MHESLVTGHVIEQNKQPVNGVVVQIINTELGAVTDHHGHFHIHITNAMRLPEPLRLTLTRIGYRTDTVLAEMGQDNELLLYRADVVFGDILVTGKRLAGNKTTLSTADLDESTIDELRGSTVIDALTSITGITTLRTGAAVAKPVIHGVSGQRIVTSMAGMSIEGQQWADDHGVDIDPFIPVTIQVMKGSDAVRYGPGAMGGVIAFEPSYIRQGNQWSGKFSGNVFSNTVQAAMGVQAENGNLMNLPVGVRMFAGARKAGNAHAPAYALGNTGFEQISGGGQVVLGNPNEAQVHLFGYRYQANIGVLSASHSGNIQDLQRAIASDTPLVSAGSLYEIHNPRQTSAHTAFVAEGLIPITSIGKLSIRYGWQQNDRNEYDSHNLRVTGVGMDSTSRATDSTLKLSALLATPALSLRLTTYMAETMLRHRVNDWLEGTLGLTALRQVNSIGGKASIIPDFEQWGVGVFLRERWLVHPSLELDGGVRYDHRWLHTWPGSMTNSLSAVQRRIYHSLSGSLGLMWYVTDEVSVLANFSHSWRPPSASELYSNGVHHGAAQYEIGDSTLGIESMTGGSLQCVSHTGPLRLDIAAYVNVYSNFIFATPVPDKPTVTIRGVFPTFIYHHTNALIAGTDVSAEANVTKEIAAKAQATILYGQDMLQNQPLFRMPANRFRLAIHVHVTDAVGIENFYAEMGVRRVAQQHRYVSAQDLSAPPAGYTVADMQLGGSLPVMGVGSKWSLQIFNLLNNRYRDYLSRYRYFADDMGIDVSLRCTLYF